MCSSDLGGDADQVAHDGDEAGSEDAEAAELGGPCLGQFHLGGRDEEELAVLQHKGPAGPAGGPVHDGRANPGADGAGDDDAAEAHVAGLLGDDDGGRDDGLTREGDDRAFDRHQQGDEKVAAIRQLAGVPFEQSLEEVVHWQKKGRQCELPAQRVGCGSDVRLGLAETGDAVAFLPLAALLQDGHALEALEDVAFDDQTVGALETFVLGHGENRWLADD